jgi:hypothetical protein
MALMSLLPEALVPRRDGFYSRRPGPGRLDPSIGVGAVASPAAVAAPPSKAVATIAAVTACSAVTAVAPVAAILAAPEAAGPMLSRLAVGGFTGSALAVLGALASIA